MAQVDVESKQGRFADGSTESTGVNGLLGLDAGVVHSLLSSGSVDLGRSVLGSEPRLSDVQRHDTWMQGVMLRDPYLMGMLSKAAAADASRGWSVFGGRNTVNHVRKMLLCADDDRGWFAFAEELATSFLTRNMGAFVELQRRFAPVYDEEERDWVYGLAQVVALYNMDATKVKWRNQRGAQGPDPDFPITFERRIWGRHDFFHLVAWPWDEDSLRRTGRCALHRCINAARLMVLIYDWETGTLDPTRLDALMLLSGASSEQVGEAFGQMEQAVEEKGDAARRLGVIANALGEVKGDLFFLRRRPESLEDFERRIRLLLELYALALGRDLKFFFPTTTSSSSGGGGWGRRTSREVTMLHTVNENADIFHPKLQEALQKYVIPGTVHFEFDGTEIAESEENARLQEVVVMARNLYEARRSQPATINAEGEWTAGTAEYLATREEVRRFMAELHHTRFGHWSDEEEEVSATDAEEIRIVRRLREMPHMQALIDGYRAGRYGDDELVRFRWWYDTRRRQQHVLSESLGVSVSEFARRRSFAVGTRNLAQGVQGEGEALRRPNKLGAQGPGQIGAVEHDVSDGAYATGNGEVLA
ncbi:MAG: hypothetical protein KDE46_11770 [Caldilineaceae bacterium]|nr:hypothetical protein [Caldilineaceae bacterium]